VTHDEWRKDAERKEAEYQAQRAARKAEYDARIKAMLNEITDRAERFSLANAQTRKGAPAPKSKPARKPRPSRAKTPAGLARWEARHGATVARC
jgi:hypothetical protein